MLERRHSLSLEKPTRAQHEEQIFTFTDIVEKIYIFYNSETLREGYCNNNEE